MDPKWRRFIQKKKQEYSALEKIVCPALKEEVYFTSAGLRHIIRKNGVLRTQEEQIRRFNLVPKAREILKNSKITSTYFTNESKGKIFHYWSFEGDLNIKVVVRQVNSGPKHFYSIFDEDNSL